LRFALFVTGLAGVLARRNIIVVLLSIEIMLNAAGLAFIAAGSRWRGLMDKSCSCSYWRRPPPKARWDWRSFYGKTIVQKPLTSTRPVP